MDRLNVLHSHEFPIDRYVEALQRESINPIAVPSLQALADIDRSGSLNVVLLDPALANSGTSILDGGTRTTFLAVGLANTRRFMGEESIFLALPEEPSLAVMLSSLRRSFQYLFQKVRTEQLEKQLAERNQELREINEVGIALSTLRNHEHLIQMILAKSRELSRADAGSLYLLEDTEEGEKVLRWKLAQNDSITVDFEEKVLPITKKSLAGFVALTGETLVIDDAYRLPENVEYSINRSFDMETGYRTRSMLVIPMTNHRGDLIGVLQLINRKRAGAPAKLTAADVPDQVIAFDAHTIDVVRSLAGQAAVAVENNLLYESIERLFEGFVTAAVTAIEQRDPTTSGHSFRVADLTVALARVLDRTADGPFRDIRFSIDQLREIRYASLLHDFGKVGVREQVLVKEKKLYPLHIDGIRSRFEYAMKALEADYTKRKLDHLLAHGKDGFEEMARQLDEEFRSEIDRLQHDLRVVAQSNEPTVLPEGDFQYLQGLSQRFYTDGSGVRRPLVTEDEVRVLSIRKGNLDQAERGEIESHVTHTFEFLSKIPWTRDLRYVPEYAYAHHEKMNGRGYPRKLLAEAIPIQSRMMTVSDIYDALTASDRPYKRSIGTDRALDILQMEVNEGLLDRDVVNVFVEAKVYDGNSPFRSPG